MRSLLFVPADGGTKLDKAMASGADAVIIDLEDSIAPERKRRRAPSALAFLKERTEQRRPRLLVRINGLDTGMTDADLDAIVPAARRDCVSEGGRRRVVHLDAKLTAREAIAGLPEGSIKILAQAVESAAGLFAAGTYRRLSARLIGMTWGPEDLSAELGAEANRDSDGRLTEPYRLARSLCLFGAAAAGRPGVRDDLCRFRNDGRCGATRKTRAATASTGRLAIHPAQVPVINAVFLAARRRSPRAKIVAAFAAKPGAGTIGIDGKMYDRPHLARARRCWQRMKPRQPRLRAVNADKRINAFRLVGLEGAHEGVDPNFDCAVGRQIFPFAHQRFLPAYGLAAQQRNSAQ